MTDPIRALRPEGDHHERWRKTRDGMVTGWLVGMMFCAVMSASAPSEKTVRGTILATISGAVCGSMTGIVGGMIGGWWGGGIGGAIGAGIVCAAFFIMMSGC